MTGGVLLSATSLSIGLALDEAEFCGPFGFYGQLVEVNSSSPAKVDPPMTPASAAYSFSTLGAIDLSPAWYKFALPATWRVVPGTRYALVFYTQFNVMWMRQRCAYGPSAPIFSSGLSTDFGASWTMKRSYGAGAALLELSCLPAPPPPGATPSRTTSATQTATRGSVPSRVSTSRSRTQTPSVPLSPSRTPVPVTPPNPCVVNPTASNAVALSTPILNASVFQTRLGIFEVAMLLNWLPATTITCPGGTQSFAAAFFIPVSQTFCECKTTAINMEIYTATQNRAKPGVFLQAWQAFVHVGATPGFARVSAPPGGWTFNPDTSSPSTPRYVLVWSTLIPVSWHATAAQQGASAPMAFYTLDGGLWWFQGFANGGGGFLVQYERVIAAASAADPGTALPGVPPSSVSPSAAPAPAAQQPGTPLTTPAAALVAPPASGASGAAASLSAAAAGGIAAGGAFVVAFIALVAALLVHRRQKKPKTLAAPLGDAGPPHDLADFDRIDWSAAQQPPASVAHESASSVRPSACAQDVSAVSVAVPANSPRDAVPITVARRPAAAGPADFEIVDLPSVVSGSAVGSATVPAAFTYRNDAFGRHAAVQRGALPSVSLRAAAAKRSLRPASAAAAAATGAGALAGSNNRSVLLPPVLSSEVRAGASRRYRGYAASVQRRGLNPNHPLWGADGATTATSASVATTAID